MPPRLPKMLCLGQKQRSSPKPILGFISHCAAGNPNPKPPGPPATSHTPTAATTTFCGFHPSEWPKRTPRPWYRCTLGHGEPVHGAHLACGMAIFGQNLAPRQDSTASWHRWLEIFQCHQVHPKPSFFVVSIPQNGPDGHLGAHNGARLAPASRHYGPTLRRAEGRRLEERETDIALKAGGGKPNAANAPHASPHPCLESAGGPVHGTVCRGAGGGDRNNLRCYGLCLALWQGYGEGSPVVTTVSGLQAKLSSAGEFRSIANHSYRKAQSKPNNLPLPAPSLARPSHPSSAESQKPFC